MRKVILTAPNGKVYIAKTKYPLNDSFNSLAPSIKDTNKYFSEKDLKFIKETQNYKYFCWDKAYQQELSTSDNISHIQSS